MLEPEEIPSYNELFPRADSGAGEGKVGIEEQIDCARRELQLRRAVYPRQIAKRRISAAFANAELRRMDAIVKTLEWIRANRAGIAEQLKKS